MSATLCGLRVREILHSLQKMSANEVTKPKKYACQTELREL